MTAAASGSPSLAAVLNPVKPSIATTSTRLRQDSSRSASQALKPAGAAFDHAEQPGRAGTVADAGQVNDHGDVLVTTPGVAPHVLVDADRGDVVEPAGVVDEDALPLGQDSVVGGVPGDPEPFGDTGDSEVLADNGFKRPPSPRRESFARGSAALVVSCRHTLRLPETSSALVETAASGPRDLGRGRSVRRSGAAAVSTS